MSLPPRPENNAGLEAYETSLEANRARKKRREREFLRGKAERRADWELRHGTAIAARKQRSYAEQDRMRNFVRSRKISAMMTQAALQERQRRAEERQREREEWMRERERERNEREERRQAAIAYQRIEAEKRRHEANEQRRQVAKSITSQAFQKALNANERRQVAKSITSQAFQKALNANEQRRAANAAAREAHSVHNAHMSRMFTNVHEILNKQEAEAKRRRNEAEAKRNEARSAAKKRSGFWRVATAATAGLALSAGYRPTTHAGNGIPPSHRSPTVFRNHGYAGTVSLTSPTSPMSPMSPTYAPVVRPRSPLPNYRSHRQVAASIEGPDFREVLNSRGPAPGTSVVRPRSALPNYRSSAQGPDSPSTRSSTLGDASRWAMNFGSKGWRRDALRGPPRRKR